MKTCLFGLLFFLSTILTNGQSQTNLLTVFTNNVPLAPQTSKLVDAPHNLGATPSVVRCVLVCVNPNNGYSSGDEVPAELFFAPVGGTDFSYGANSTNVWVSYYINPKVLNKAGNFQGAIYTADWTVKVLIAQ